MGFYFQETLSGLYYSEIELLCSHWVNEIAKFENCPEGSITDKDFLKEMAPELVKEMAGTEITTEIIQDYLDFAWERVNYFSVYFGIEKTEELLQKAYQHWDELFNRILA